MNPAEILPVAKHLVKPPKGMLDEAAFRGSCGRAYYYAFTSAREVLLAAKFPVPKHGGGHQAVIDLLKASTNADVKSAGGQLDQLHTTRKSADYDVGSIKVAGTPFVAFRAQLAIAQAETIVGAIQKARSADAKIGIP